MLKTKKELRKMFFDNFLGTIADNLVETNWALVMAWYPNIAYAQKSLTMFAVTDTLWVVLSCAYYAVRTALVANLPAYMVGKSAEKASKPLKKWEGFEGFFCIKIRKIENISELFRDSLF